MAVQPAYLEKGDTIRIVATARHIEKEPVEFAVKYLTEKGFNVELGDNIHGEEGYLAGSDSQRALDLQNALNAEHVKMVLCARGGYGSVRILDKVDWSGYVANPKWICGFSDVTALHHRSSTIGIQSVHSTMPINFESNSAEALNSLLNAVSGVQNVFEWTATHLVDARDIEAEIVNNCSKPPS